MEVQVADPFIELRTGPGRGYPVTQVVERGATVAIVMRRTDWYQVRTEGGIKGWVHRRDMARTLEGTGELLPVADPSLVDFTNHDWEFGLEVGDFGGANAISGYGSYSLNESLSTELHLSHILGDQTNQYIIDIGIVHSIIMPDVKILNRFTPFVGLGTGVLRLEPKAQFAQQLDSRTDQIAYVGAGVKFYLTRQFIARAEYRWHVVFTNRDDNQEVEEWKAGFAFFF
ncbi:MAG TPA: SH3 domain-containing protein [Steroidobacteraceae bacterium]|nr:SH3 domain-containing protein [Steroidobacteraceae bacterium]